MGKATGVGSIVVGFIMVLLGIGAFFSGEAASETSQGKMVVGFIIILGLAAIYGGVTANQKAATQAKQAQQATQFPQATQYPQTMEPPPPPPDAVATGFCPYCGRGIQADFVVCPFCGKSTKSICPKCGKQVQKDFVACPYCGTVLKSA
jgi:RNA polymerase subunit RPABC4/transcription elongation factor Spt4